MPNRVKYLLLDVHGVLLKAGARKRFLPLMKRRYGMDMDRHNDIFERHLDGLDTGRINRAKFLRAINGAFGTHVSGKEYDDLLSSQFRANKTLIERLANVRGCRLCIASDDWPTMAPRLGRIFERSLDIYRKFYSFQYKRRKADGMLKDVLRELGAKPGECLFIDDREINIATARKVGIDAVLFTTNRKLFADLRKRGITL